VTVTKENMGFGYGRHACPGRFFAATEIKLIVARILLDYDLKLPEGQTERYPNIAIANNYVPDMKKELVFRRISE
jgi:cytochrome P450